MLGALDDIYLRLEAKDGFVSPTRRDLITAGRSLHRECIL
jgi:hypothetical protein